MALPQMREGEALGGSYRAEKKQTKPPRRFTDATLLGAMESAGRKIDDEALREAMKDRGLGTPATRASMIETLITRGYCARDQKALVSTPLGDALIAGLPVPALASPELTGEWEERLAGMARGAEKRETFMGDVRAAVRDMVERVTRAPGIAPPSARRDLGAVTGVRCPVCDQGELIVGRKAWGCSRWREGCRGVFPFEGGLPAKPVAAKKPRVPRKRKRREG